MSFENILKKVIQEISRELGHRNIQIKEAFVKYYASLLTLDPNWGISKKVLHNRFKIQKFVKYVTTKLVHQFDPDIITLKMQLYFRFNCEPREEIVRKFRAVLNSKLLPLQKDIIRLKNVNDQKMVKKFYKKLVYYISLSSGMGNPTFEAVYREIYIALKSVLSENEMKSFVSNSVQFKKDNMDDLCDYVSGIRIFNKDCGKGGEGIDDVPKLIKRGLEVMKNDSQKTLLSILQRANFLTAILESHYIVRKLKADEYHLVGSSLPEGIDSNDVDRIKNTLVLYRQYEVLIRKLQEELNVVEDREEEMSDRMRVIIDRIHETIHFKIAVPAYQVFPMFQELAQVWYSLQNEALLMYKYNEIMANLNIYVKQIQYGDFERQDYITEQVLSSYLYSLETVQHLDSSLRKCDVPGYRIVPPTEIKGKIECEFLGFCAWKLVASGGALIPGNLDIGYVEGNGKKYLFSNETALNMFILDPKNVLLRALELFRNKPELIHLLGVYEDLHSIKDIEELIPPTVAAAEVYHVECQTELHPIKSNINYRYRWNVWDLKREALLLAQVSHCQTHSVQTEECGGLKPCKTQTYEIRDKAVQTKVENGTKMPKPSTYLVGLRGRKDDRQFKIDLTRPITEE